MTVADTVNALTGDSFHATKVTAAITASEILVAGYINETYTASVDNGLDSAVALAAANMLKSGKIDGSNMALQLPQFNQQVGLSSDVTALLDNYISRSGSEKSVWNFSTAISSKDYNV